MDNHSKVSVEFIQFMTSGSICRNCLPWQERWCVVMGGHLLHPDVTADVSGAARAHSLQEMLILMKLVGASFW